MYSVFVWSMMLMPAIVTFLLVAGVSVLLFAWGRSYAREIAPSVKATLRQIAHGASFSAERRRGMANNSGLVTSPNH